VSGRLGWKVGFGSPASLERLRLEKPLVAPLPAVGRLEDGAVVSIGGWTAPLLEAEVAVWVGHGLGAAIELADLEFPPDDVDRILASGIYHRHVILGPPRAPTLDGVAARVICDGDEIASTDDVEALTGRLDAVLAAVRGHAGRDLRAGEVVIAGAVVPPIPLRPGQRYEVDLGPLGSLAVSLAP
jgi:2-keto-4-pentenoate hydratase